MDATVEGPEQLPWFEGATAQALGRGLRPGDLSVSLHLPEGSAIDMATVERSMADARRLLDAIFPSSTFPSSTRRILTGSSWMLDDQLGDLLTAESNIVHHRPPAMDVPARARLAGR